MSLHAGSSSASGGASGTVTSVSVATANGFSGTVATATTTPAITIALAASAITYAKIQNVAASSLLGNPTGSPAAPSELALGPNFTLSGSTLYGAVDHPGYVSGNWYSPCPFAASAAGAAIPINSIRLMPFTLSKPLTISALAARVTTISAAGNFQLAIYANNAATGKPTGSALCSTGNISTGTLGPFSNTASATLNPGTYWMAINQDNAVAVYTTLGLTTPTTSYLVGSATLANITSSSTAQFLILTTAQTFGTWPDLTSASFAETATQTSALVFMKAA